nr:NAD(P)-binding domain-containing protein [Ulvibacterium marinum]
MENIGFIGLGIMGSRMARNLQKAGYGLTLFNRTKSKAKDLLAQGAKWANSPKEVVLDNNIYYHAVNSRSNTGSGIGKKWVFANHVQRKCLGKLQYGKSFVRQGDGS